MELYSNTLLKSFNETYDKVLLKEETDRKEIANMIYCFYTGNKSAINYYIEKYMTDSATNTTRIYNSMTGKLETIASGNQIGIFSGATVRIMPKIHIDLVTKILDLTCTIYNTGVDRYLTDENGEVNQEETDKLMKIYSDMDFNKRIKDIYKAGYLFNTVLVQSNFYDGKNSLQIITPNFCSVNSYEHDYNIPKEIFISKNINNQDMIVYWNKSEHYYTNYSNEKIPVTNDEGISNNYINPYGKLPFTVLRFNESSEFWGEPQQDLIENNIWYDIREANSLFVEFFQGLGVGLGINLNKQGQINISPNTTILVDGVRVDMVPPSLEFTNTNAPLSELRENSDYFYKRIGNSKGLSPQTMNNEVSSQSGIAKMYDSAELLIKRDLHKDVMITFENNFFQTLKMVNNHWNNEYKIPENLNFKIEYLKPEYLIDTLQAVEKQKFELETGIKSAVDLIIAENPDLTTDEAIQILEKNIKLNQEYGQTEKITDGNNTGKSNSKNS